MIIPTALARFLRALGGLVQQPEALELSNLLLPILELSDAAPGQLITDSEQVTNLGANSLLSGIGRGSTPALPDAGFYRIAAGVTHVAAHAGVRLYELIVEDEVGGAQYVMGQVLPAAAGSSTETTLFVPWPVYIPNTNWLIALRNRTAIGVGETTNAYVSAKRLYVS